MLGRREPTSVRGNQGSGIMPLDAKEQGAWPKIMNRAGSLKLVIWEQKKLQKRAGSRQKTEGSRENEVKC